jgi:hypothetical protein
VQSLLQWFYGGGVPLGESRGDPVQEEVHRTGRRRGRTSRARRLGRFHYIAEPAAEDGGIERLQVRLPRQRVAQVLESVGRVEEQGSGIAAAPASEDDLGPQPREVGALKVVQRADLRGREQVVRGVRLAGPELGAGGGQRSPGAPYRIGRQLGSPLQKGSGGGQTTACPGPVGGTLQFGGHHLVEPYGGVGAVPGSPIRIHRGIGGFGQGTVHAAPVRLRGVPVDDGTDQRMPEPHSGTDVDQVGGFRRCSGVGTDPQPLGSPPEQGGVTDRLSGGGQHQQPRLGRQRLEATPEAFLDPAGQRTRVRSVRESEATCQLAGRQSTGQLHQRQRIASRLGHEPVPDALVDDTPERHVQQGAGIAEVQTRHDEFGQAGQLIGGTGVTDREDQRHPLGQQPARHERQGLSGHAVQPLSVVDQTDQRLVLGNLGQEVQHRDADQEAVRRITRTQAERGIQGVVTGGGEVRPQLGAQLVQAAVRQLQLGLDAGYSHDAARGGMRLHVVQQGGLADSGFAAEYERTALPGSKTDYEPIERLALALPALQLDRHRPPPNDRA